MAMKPSHGAGRTAPMSGQVSGKEPRYDYASPTIKQQFGKPPALGYDIAEYGLPAIDVQSEMRNFPGYTEANYYSLENIQDGDISGATDSDSATEKLPGRNTGGGYTKINQKSGPRSKWNSRSS